MLNYYLVRMGKAVHFDCRKHNHSEDEKSIFVYADDPESAVNLAIKYPEGEIRNSFEQAPLTASACFGMFCLPDLAPTT